MSELDDHQLLAEFARKNSEAAFAALVQRHVNLVYSVALRSVGNVHDAEEITQAVFIILARKAKSFSRKTILSGWLYQTTQLTAANFLRGEIRRQKREQEAYMQSALNEPDANIWPQIAPLLDDALAKLGEKDRDAIVLRFFENKSLAEVGVTLGASEDAAKMRVNRALEKLRKFFTKRGVTLSGALIAGAVSANSVQAAPVGLAKTISAVAIAKGAAAGGSTLTLVKGTLKIMAWTKVKTAIVVGATILVAGTATTVVMEKSIMRMNSILTQQLDDGSTLILNRVSFGDSHKFGPRGKTNSWSSDREMLVVEFRLNSNHGAIHPLAKPAFFRQFRCILHGEKGIEYAEEFMPNQFNKDSGSYYSYIETSVFPRDSRWLWFRIEKSETNNPYGPWQTVAEFKTANPARSANRAWVASPVPTTNTADGMNFVLGEVTVETRPYTPRDIWNHVVTVPTQVFDGGVLLTNWSAMHFQLQDASGNSSPVLQKHRSLDPRFVWKLEMDFEPDSGFQVENMVTVNLSKRPSTFTTNIMNVPVTISLDAGDWINASMPTNRPSLGLRYISATDDHGENLFQPSGGGGQYSFREGSFMVRRGGILHMDGVKPATVTFAIVPNVHTTFYVQPRLVGEHEMNGK